MYLIVTADESSVRASTLARWITRAPVVISRHLWLWPLLGAIALIGVGWWVHDRVETATREELASRLKSLLEADVAALRLWFAEKESDTRAFVADVRVQKAIRELVDMSRQPELSPAMLANSGSAAALQANLQPLIEAQNYLDYVVLGTNRVILASPQARMVGRPAPRAYDSFLRRALSGSSAVSAPFERALNASQNAHGPAMFVAAPVKSADDQVLAVLALRLKPEEEFSRIFSVARMGETGEAYAFDRRGVMLTASRFDPELKRLGLIPNDPQATSILNLQLLDPGVDLDAGERPARPRQDLPLTRMAAAATKGWKGYDVAGYRNYRGVKVVGAWEWVPRYSMGVATEVAADEAFQTLYVLRRAFLLLFILLALSAGAIFGFTLLVERLQKSVRRNALAARRLGQYVLVQEIGRGSNGMVYRARHALLRRPVAIKLLSPDMTNETTAARFEHEVQMTSQLTHPNTVAIYDYGRTPEGLFFYAMEFLSGIDLDRLVRQFGALPEGRVIHILRQVCGSLAEAHQIGLIHRDIKPANIVLTRRGGVCDLVKVLDFGLVKTNRPIGHHLANAVVGTPHFISPEGIETPERVDARADLYSVGAVGYWLLTGTTLFTSEVVEDLLVQHVKASPLPPSERLGRRVSPDLEAVLMRCLAKSPAERPADAAALEHALGECEAAGTWTAEDSANWWKDNVPSVEPPPPATKAEKTLVIGSRH